MLARICDICGEAKESERFRYKIKIEKETFCWDDRWWSNLDICNDCQERIIELIKQRKKADLIKKEKNNE